MTYTMDIEKPAGVIKQHGFHLGTIREIAWQFVLERLRSDPSIVSVALKRDGKTVGVYDHRDLDE